MGRDDLSPKMAEWIETQYQAGKRLLSPDDPYWSDHFLADHIQASFDCGEDVPIFVLLASNQPLTDDDIRRGRELAREYDGLKGQ